MKIKRFLAPDMRTALQNVRQEHGPDAVILSNRVTPEGVEIVAASQYDEDTVLRALDPSSASTPALTEGATTMHADGPETTTSSRPEPPCSHAPDAVPHAVCEAAPVPAFSEHSDLEEDVAAPLLDASCLPVALQEETLVPVSTASKPAPALAASAPDTSHALSVQMRDGFAQLQQVIERGLERLGHDHLSTSPLHQSLLEWMEPQGFTPHLIRELAATLEANQVVPGAHQAEVIALLSERLPVSTSNLLDEGGAIALVGPSGAGKTTIIGKLAAHYSVRRGVRDIALISLDHARPGGSDRLYSLARQLGMAVHEADSQQSLATLLQWLQDYHLILIDSAGHAPHDPHFSEQLEWLRAVESVRSFLVLPANTHHADLEDVVTRFQPLRPQGAIVTKLDETRRPGGVFSIAMEQQLPLSWVSDGQHLHDDLHRADAARLLRRVEAALPGAEHSLPDPVATSLAAHAIA